MGKEDWQAINVRKELVNQLKSLPDAKHISQSGLVNRAIDEWLSNRGSLVTPSQLYESAGKWSDEEKTAAFLFLAKHVAADLIAQDNSIAHFLESLVKGHRPSDAEIVEIAQTINLHEDQLIALCDRLFPDKSFNGAKP